MSAVPSWWRRLTDPRFVRESLTFLGGSAAGLAIDLLGFQMLVSAGLEPGAANAISSFASITVVYLLVTRYTFGADTSARTYVAFVAWYTLSIITFSTLIQVAADLSDWPAFVLKLISVPVSFCLNYAFSRFLYRDRRGGPGSTGDAPEPVA